LSGLALRRVLPSRPTRTCSGMPVATPHVARATWPCGISRTHVRPGAEF
jgi:hypothetical protein